MSQYLLSLLILIPVFAALGSLLVPATQSRIFKIINLSVAVIQLALLVCAISLFDITSSDFQLMERANWFSISLGNWGLLRAEYFLAVDGLGFSMIILTVIVMIITAISSWEITANTKGYFVLLMIMNGAIVGTFCALDLLLFYLFFEFMLLPMYFLIGLWGGPNREYASIKFLLFTLFGSILILIVIIGLYTSVKDPSSSDIVVHTFNLLHMGDGGNFISGSALSADGWTLGGYSLRTWAFVLLLIGFLIKLPAVPFHTWLPDAHVEAPTAVSVVLAALLLKIGGYGLLRIAYPIFPDIASTLSWLVATVAVVSIVYGALNALASKDLKRLIAYSSVSHMGFVLLGIASTTSTGVTGAVYQMFSHGILSALLFLIAGVLSGRTQNRMIENYSGLSTKMPIYFGIVLVAFFASLGLPGFSGFIAEITVLFGAFESMSTNGLISEAFAIVATIGLLLNAGYFLWTIQRMFFGKFNVKGDIKAQALTDLHQREISMMGALIVLTLVFGLFPQVLLDYINPFANNFVDQILNHL
jgi:NADH-quinone oxidoreductase subunit M